MDDKKHGRLRQLVDELKAVHHDLEAAIERQLMADIEAIDERVGAIIEQLKELSSEF